MFRRIDVCLCFFKQTKDEYVYKQHEKAAKDEQIVEWRFYFIIHKKIYHCVDYKYGNNRYYSQCSDFIDGKSYIGSGAG